MRTEEEHRSDLPLVQRRPHADRVRPQQIVLQGPDVVTAEPDVRETAEAGGDPVHRLLGAGLAGDHVPRGVQASPGVGGELDRLSSGRRHHVLDRQRLPDPDRHGP